MKEITTVRAHSILQSLDVRISKELESENDKMAFLLVFTALNFFASDAARVKFIELLVKTSNEVLSENL